MRLKAMQGNSSNSQAPNTVTHQVLRAHLEWAHSHLACTKDILNKDNLKADTIILAKQLLNSNTKGTE